MAIAYVLLLLAIIIYRENIDEEPTPENNYINEFQLNISTSKYSPEKPPIKENSTANNLDPEVRKVSFSEKSLDHGKDSNFLLNANPKENKDEIVNKTDQDKIVADENLNENLHVDFKDDKSKHSNILDFKDDIHVDTNKQNYILPFKEDIYIDQNEPNDRLTSKSDFHLDINEQNNILPSTEDVLIDQNGITLQNNITSYSDNVEIDTNEENEHNNALPYKDNFHSDKDEQNSILQSKDDVQVITNEQNNVLSLKEDIILDNNKQNTILSSNDILNGENNTHINMAVLHDKKINEIYQNENFNAQEFNENAIKNFERPIITANYLYDISLNSLPFDNSKENNIKDITTVDMNCFDLRNKLSEITEVTKEIKKLLQINSKRNIDDINTIESASSVDSKEKTTNENHQHFDLFRLENTMAAYYNKMLGLWSEEHRTNMIYAYDDVPITQILDLDICSNNGFFL